MLNIEYYKDKLVKLGVININGQALVHGKLQNCGTVRCSECSFNTDKGGGSYCSNNALKWLLSEHKEPEIDWSKVKVDTPILVRNTEEEEWRKRHFAGFKYGKVCAWLSGATSWTANSNMNSWKYAKLAESEE